jgi:methionyl-tRNA formyltransferase
VRVAFAGSPQAAVPVLRALADSDHEVALVISQPDRPRGRAGAASPTPVTEAAQGLGLEALRPTSINDPETLETLEEASIGALCVAAYGQILREPLLSLWPCLNVHYSLLPAYRGAAPIERALMDGVEETGVTIMQMDAGLDTGPLVSSRAVAVEPDDDAGSLTARLGPIGGALLVSALDDLDAGRFDPTPQPRDGVSLAPKLTDADRILDFSRPAVALADQVRALSPHLGAFCWIDGQRFKIWRASASDERLAEGLTVDGDRLLVGCGDGSLEILELQPPNRSRVPAAAFIRGWRGALELGRS